MDDPRYERFNVSVTTYKTVNGHDLRTYVLVPKDAPKGKRPVYVKFHGGFLVRISPPILFKISCVDK
jgi:dipeptidyl aminopeptidase/acylaminoacyl peptidase